MSNFKNKIAFYCKNKDGTVNELILNLFEKDYEYVENIDERELWVKGNSTRLEIQLEPSELEKLFSTIDHVFVSGTTYIETESYEIRQEIEKQEQIKESKRTLVSKERLWQAIKWECDQKELDELFNYDKYRYEEDYYFDLKLIIDKIYAYLAQEKSVEYFTSWLLLLMRCIGEATICENDDQREIYEKIADELDGFSFMTHDFFETQNHSEYFGLIGRLIDYNTRLKNESTKRKSPLQTNNVTTYVAFFGCLSNNKDDAFFKVCVADNKRKVINLLFVKNLVFNEKIKYTFLTGAEFDCLFKHFYGRYSFDSTIKEDYAITKK